MYKCAGTALPARQSAKTALLNNACAPDNIKQKSLPQKSYPLTYLTTMNNPALYEKSNGMPKRDVLLCLEQYALKIKWKKGNNNILDIGCGDGSVTNMLKTYIPTDFKLLGCDISEKMVNFANDHYSNEKTYFTVLDIAGDMPEKMKGTFDFVFSFYTLHWITDQQRAFDNIYNLLNEDGTCLIMFLAAAPVFEVYRILAHDNKWSEWVQDVDRYVSPYQDCENPEKEVTKMLDQIGFVDYDVQCKNSAFVFEDLHVVRNLFSSVNPFKIPKEKHDDFMADYMNVLKELPIMTKYNNNYEKAVHYRYRLLVIYARKPASQEKL